MDGEKRGGGGRKKCRCKARGYLHVGHDVSGAYGVHLNVMLAPFVAESLGKLSKGTFRRRVGWNGEATLEGEKRAKVDYLAASERNHVPSSCL